MNCKNLLLIRDIWAGLRAAGQTLWWRSPEIGSIPIDEVASVGIAWDVVTPTKHGGQHGVLKPPQRGQARGEVHAPDVQRNDLWEL